MSFSRQFVLPLLAVGGLVVAACGDDSPSATATAARETPADTEAPVETDASADAEAPADTDAPVETDAPADTEAPVDSTEGSGDGSEFCDFVDRTKDTDELLDSITGDPADIEAAMTELRDRVEELRDMAPDAIADETDVFVDAILMLVDAFEAADYNFLDADLGFLEDAEMGELVARATERIDEFSTERCGQSLGVSDGESDDSEPVDEDGADDDDFSLDGGTIREQFIEQFVGLGFTLEEATCLAEKVDVTNGGLLEGATDDVLALFDECDISLSRLGEIGG